VVDEVVRAVEPAEVILFGSVARGEDGPDSDIDLLVVFDHIEPAEKRPMMASIRSAIETFAPVDVIVTDPAEMAERHDAVGSILYWPTREGRSVYRRECPSSLIRMSGCGSPMTTSGRLGCS
jgi:uncharacterized protein